MNINSRSNALPNLGPEVYEQWRQSDLGAITEDLQSRLLLRLIGGVASKAVLDVGCGDGTFAIELAQRGGSVSAIDASCEMIDAARKIAKARQVQIAFDVSAAQALPFPQASFDVVVAKTVLCFVDDAAPVFAELARVLRPGGKLVIGELGRWSTWAASRRIRSWLGSALWKRGRFRTPAELQALARAASLNPSAVVGAIYYPRSTVLARLMAPYDESIAHLTTFGAAFLGLEATKQ
ncbi:MAG: class I SAM-dependent methyltransferase [Hyphomicrobiaceae bacterium]